MSDVRRQPVSLGEAALTGRRHPWQPYLELAKLRLNLMVLVTTALGYLLAGPEQDGIARLVVVLLGTGIAAIGSGALNQYVERDVDRLMRRTSSRPLPDGRVSENRALLFGMVCFIGGSLLLALWINILSGLLCALAGASYLLVYTPLKRRGPVSTLVGAVPGALPPMIGWAAARGELSVGAWVLFSILFMWQLPHFFSIAWIYREDYRRAGMPMISHLDEEGLGVAQHIVLCTLNLVFVSLLPAAVGLAGPVYLLAAVVLGTGFLLLGLRFLQRRTIARARQVMFGSLVYLPSLLTACLLSNVA